MLAASPSRRAVSTSVSRTFSGTRGTMSQRLETAPHTVISAAK